MSATTAAMSAAATAASARASALSARKSVASAKPYAGKSLKLARRVVAAATAKTSTPELDINTKVFEKELVDVAGEGEYIVKGGRHLF